MIVDGVKNPLGFNSIVNFAAVAYELSHKTIEIQKGSTVERWFLPRPKSE